ncbi:MAG: hypothetical protein KA714_15030 [Limnoraphis sp. WC205]|jgi:hypothetical protein|nr:hypothetical protein [Limnoraphis sp. WC205]
MYLIQQYDVVFKSRQSYYQIFKEAKMSWQKAEHTMNQFKPFDFSG